MPVAGFLDTQVRLFCFAAFFTLDRWTSDFIKLGQMTFPLRIMAATAEPSGHGLSKTILSHSALLVERRTIPSCRRAKTEFIFATVGKTPHQYYAKDGSV
jgi:hypothetical protein